MGEKWFYVIKIIQDSIEPVSAKEILEQLKQYNINMNIKTVYETISRINDFYYLLTDKLYIKTVRRKGYSIENEYFDDGQLQYVLDSIVFNQNLSQNEISNLLEKVLMLSSTNQKSRISINQPTHQEQNFSLLLNLTTLLQAINQQHTVYFEYVNYKVEQDTLIEISSTNGNLKLGKHNYYLVSPYQIVLRNSNYYLLGYFDKRKNQLSMYRVDRMRMIRTHNSKFIEIREQFDMNQELENNVNMFISNKRIDLTFKFKDSILREVVNQFGHLFTVKKLVDGWNQATVQDVALSNGLIGWILMLQDQIEILYPLEVKDEIITTIKNLSNIYQL